MAVSAAERLGIDDRLRRLRRAWASPNELRNERDEAALRVLMSGILNPDSNSIDVGAHRGSVLEEIIRLAPHGRHIAYEPVADDHAALARRFPQVDVRAKALSNRTGVSEFLVATEAPAYSALQWVPARPDTAYVYPTEEQLPTRAVEVEVERLDDAVPNDFRVDFIKIDVEGAEYQVLEGGMETLCTDRPVVAFEHSLGCQRYGAEPGGVYELLAGKAGLRIFDIDGGGPYDQAAFSEEVCSIRRWFFFARP